MENKRILEFLAALLVSIGLLFGRTNTVLAEENDIPETSEPSAVENEPSDSESSPADETGNDNTNDNFYVENAPEVIEQPTDPEVTQPSAETPDSFIVPEYPQTLPSDTTQTYIDTDNNVNPADPVTEVLPAAEGSETIQPETDTPNAADPEESFLSDSPADANESIADNENNISDSPAEPDESVDSTENNAPMLRMAAAPAESSTENASVSEPDRSDNYIEGIAYMSNRHETYDMPIKFIYSDSYFYHDSTSDEYAYYPELAAMSAVIANSTNPSYRAGGYIYEDGEIKRIEEIEDAVRQENGSKNVQDLLRTIGFENIQINDAYTKIGTPVSAGVVCGMKKMIDDNGKEYTLIAFIPRSVGYLGEWANNPEVGEGGPDNSNDLLGFSSATTDYMLPFLEQYLKDNNITGDLKIWSTGMSRGGGLSNTAVAYLDDMLDENGNSDQLFGIEGLRLNQKDIYAYTFGAPHAASTIHADLIDENGNLIRNPKYNNIHNFAAEYDFLNRVLYGNWNIDRYGRDTEVALSDAEEHLAELLEMYAVINNKEISELDENEFIYVTEDGSIHYDPLEFSTYYWGDGILPKKMDLTEFLTAYMYNLTDTFTRDEFADGMQSGLQMLAKIFIGTPPEKSGNISTEVFLDAAKSKAMEIAAEAAIDLMLKDTDALIELLKYALNPLETLPDIFLDGLYNIDLAPDWNFTTRQPFTDETEEERRAIYKEYIQTMVKQALKVLPQDLLGVYGFYKSFSCLWSSHELDVYLSWQRILSSEQDQEYYLVKPTAAEAWGYRMITLPEYSNDNSMYFVLYEGQDMEDPDAVKAIIVDDELFLAPEKDHFIHMNVDSAGRRVLYLRADQAYTLEFVPFENGNTHNLSIIEFSYMGSPEIYDPENPDYQFFADDYNVDLTALPLVYLNEGETSVFDRLLLNIGSVSFDPVSGLVMTRNMDSSRSLSSSPEPGPYGHFADTYYVSKYIQLGAVADMGGSVSDMMELLFSSKEGLNIEKTATLTAATSSGYRFLGWYLNGQLISTDPTLSRTYTFFHHSELLTARFELIPSPTPTPTPDPKPTPSGKGSAIVADIPVVTNGTFSPAVQNTRVNRVPNTGDENPIQWLILLLGSLALAAGSISLLKEN